MDNGAFTGSAEEVSWAYQNLSSVFAPYQFSVQQIVTNVPSVQLMRIRFPGKLPLMKSNCWDYVGIEIGIK